jgi:hypothetical protein
VSRFFVSDQPAQIPEPDGPHGITIRPKMTMEVRARVASEVPDRTAPDADVRAVQALLVHNILAWSGPDFDGVPCTADAIRRLDVSDPYIYLVLQEIQRRNTPKGGPDPKSLVASGSPSAGETASTSSAPTTELTLPSASST